MIWQCRQDKLSPELCKLMLKKPSTHMFHDFMDSSPQLRRKFILDGRECLPSCQHYRATSHCQIRMRGKTRWLLGRQTWTSWRCSNVSLKATGHVNISSSYLTQVFSLGSGEQDAWRCVRRGEIFLCSSLCSVSVGFRPRRLRCFGSHTWIVSRRSDFGPVLLS